MNAAQSHKRKQSEAMRTDCFLNFQKSPDKYSLVVYHVHIVKFVIHSIVIISGHNYIFERTTKATPHKGKTSIHVANVVKYRHE